MKDIAIHKINGMGKVSLIISRIAKIIVVMGMICTIVGSIVTSILPEKIIQVNYSGQAQVVMNLEDLRKLKGDTSEEDIEAFIEQAAKNGTVTVDGKEYVLGEVSNDGKSIILETEARSPRVVTLRGIRNILVSCTIYMGFVLVTLLCIESLSKTIRDCQSPFDEDVINKLRIFSYSLAPWVVADSAMTSTMNYFLGNTDSIGFSINTGMVMVVLTIYGLSYIFKYGAMLQQESDETL